LLRYDPVYDRTVGLEDFKPVLKSKNKTLIQIIGPLVGDALRHFRSAYVQALNFHNSTQSSPSQVLVL
jgi:hypothetical protein